MKTFGRVVLIIFCALIALSGIRMLFDFNYSRFAFDESIIAVTVEFVFTVAVAGLAVLVIKLTAKKMKEKSGKAKE